MTLLGKIFTMLIFIMALVWMAFAVAVYMTQKNWKDLVERPQAEVAPGKPLGLTHQLENLKKENEALAVELEKIRTEVRREQASRAHALAALEEMRQREAALAKTATEAQAQLVASNSAAIAEAAAIQVRLKGLTEEIAQARLEIKTAQGDRDQQLQRVVAITDQLHQAEDMRRRLTERQVSLNDTIARMKARLDSVGMGPDTDISGKPPRDLSGVVTAVRKEFMEISIGSDDGLMVGHELEVMRDRTYKGRIIIRRVDPDKAVAEVVRELQRGEVQPGDRVMSRSSVGALTPTVRYTDLQLASQFAHADSLMSIDPLAADPLAAPQQLAPQPQAPRTQKQRSNVYTMMLIVSFAAMVTACVVLYVHLQSYASEGGTGMWWDVPQAVKTQAGG